MQKISTSFPTAAPFPAFRISSEPRCYGSSKDLQKIAQQIETKDFQIFVEWLYAMQTFALQRTMGKQKWFNQLSTQSSSWLFPQFFTLGTIIKSPPSVRPGGTKQGTGILAGHNGNPSQRMAGVCSFPHPTLSFFASFQTPEHSISTALERPMNAFWQQIKTMMFLWQ